MITGRRLQYTPPAGVLFVDILASTFAVLFLVMGVTLLRGVSEPGKELAEPPPLAATSFRIINAYFTPSEGKEHPNATFPDVFGRISIHDEYIEFYDENSPSHRTVETREEVESSGSLVKKFLERHANRNPQKKVQMVVYGHGMFYLMQEVLRGYGLSWNFNYFVDDEGENASTAVTGSSCKASLNDTKIRTLAGTDDASSAYLREYLLERILLPIWKWLTASLYLQRGYPVQYETHRDQIFFTDGDLKELSSTEQSTESWFGPFSLFLVLCLLVFYLIYEYCFGGENNQL